MRNRFASAGANVVSLAAWRAKHAPKASAPATAPSVARIYSLAVAEVPLRFELIKGVVLYSELTGLALSVDCPTMNRAYRVKWHPPTEALLVEYFWTDDCVNNYTPISDHEHKELKAWLAANDDVTDRFNFERDLLKEEEDPR